MKKLLTIILALVLAVFCFASCGNKEKPTDKTDTGKGQSSVDVTAIDNVVDYVLVRGDTCSEAEKAAMVTMRKAIVEKLNITLNVATDWTGTGGTAEVEKEILIGKTKREASIAAAEGLGYNDYVIRKVDEKIVIVGGSDDATTAAVEFFIKNFIDTATATIIAPVGDGYKHAPVYKLKGITIDGTDISEFRVFSVSKNDYAQKFADDILSTYVGRKIEVLEVGNIIETGKHYVIFDNSEFTCTDYSIKVADGNLYVTGGYKTLEDAVKYLYTVLDGGIDTLELTSANDYTGQNEKLEIPYKSKEDLMKIMNYVYGIDKTLFGQHMAGSTDPYATLEDYKGAVGKYQSIIDFDLLTLPDRSATEWSKALNGLVEFASKGGIITTMCHWKNPVGAPEGEAAYRGHLGTSETWNEVLTEGTELNKFWKSELELDAKFFKALQDYGVTVFFRPMHEANGNWFWFCAMQEKENISKEDMVRMWKYVYNYYTKECGLTNLLWDYGPNVANGSSPLPVDYYYPGDDYVDIVGCDWYTSGGYEIDGSGKSYDVLMQFGKPTGICEWGIANSLMGENMEQQLKLFTCQDYVNILFQMFREGKKIAFAEVYAGVFGAPSILGEGEVLADSEYIIFLEDMPEIIKTALGK